MEIGPNQPKNGNLVSKSAEETFAIGSHLGLSLPSLSVICFFGDLGAGKTTLIKGMASALGIDPLFVQSPTFTYLNIYEGSKKIYHFDLYRLRDVDEFLSMGFDEFFGLDGICCIEWSERIASYLPADCLKISIDHLQGDCRLVNITGNHV